MQNSEVARRECGQVGGGDGYMNFCMIRTRNGYGRCREMWAWNRRECRMALMGPCMAMRGHAKVERKEV